jgi:hypothetical protein
MVVQHLQHNGQGKVSVHIVIHQHYPQVLKDINEKLGTEVFNNKILINIVDTQITRSV